MTPVEREDLIAKISEKLKDMSDDDLMKLATENDIPVKSAAEKMAETGEEIPPMIDTSVLTGPINSLKSFLLKKQRDNEKQD